MLYLPVSVYSNKTIKIFKKKKIFKTEEMLLVS